MPEAILRLDDIHVHFPVKRNWRGKARAWAHALNGVDLAVRRGETLGVVGESGCGKTTLAQVLMGLQHPTHGQLRWNNDLGQPNVQIVFQDPQSSLDPRLPVWKIMTEPVYVKGKAQEPAMRALAARLAEQVGLSPDYLNRYPHEFSGGQRQRIAIARALASDPDVIVLDEPTSALDISVQAQIINLLFKLQREHQLTYILISHNVSVIRHMSNRIAVMYLGQIVELGDTANVLARQRHPYTRLLLDAVPVLGSVLPENAVQAIPELPGNRVLPGGCFFLDRCAFRTQGCEHRQLLKPIPEETPAHSVRCHRYDHDEPDEK
ncbi:peptide ABC transporter ATP-binding protein [Advenella sp. S44]|uniref:oligopeptide/dipeptide ABC transporter ATP-binding protein n=1 Tax=Advenella sp. S44 TaxID=1982755 RepID=UPI000C2AA8C5|nr:oligopeptide/dipeptide ABC transporter ATP-binding protein [Advenella sp. S44]PJX22161.1 peptide ABC transporter ATP-binding protein [Advenella sp. S44]